MSKEEYNFDSNSGVVARNIEGDININIPQRVVKNSIIAKLVKSIIDNNSDRNNQYKLGHAYQINDKISYNSIKKYVSIIEDYSEFYDLCEQTINKMDDYTTGTKDILFRFIHSKYLLIKCKYCGADGKIINGDGVLDEIIHNIEKYLLDCKELETIDYEIWSVNLIAIIIYCFIECQILERPPEED